MNDSGLAIHCSHDQLVQFCWKYKVRARFIRKFKPQKQRLIRLKVFRILPEKALRNLPKYLQRAYLKYKNDIYNWGYYEEAYKRWPVSSRRKFHAKWCGCKYYDAEKDELIFDKAKK